MAIRAKPDCFPKFSTPCARWHHSCWWKCISQTGDGITDAISIFSILIGTFNASYDNNTVLLSRKFLQARLIDSWSLVSTAIRRNMYWIVAISNPPLKLYVCSHINRARLSYIFEGLDIISAGGTQYFCLRPGDRSFCRDGCGRCHLRHRLRIDRRNIGEDKSCSC